MGSKTVVYKPQDYIIFYDSAEVAVSAEREGGYCRPSSYEGPATTAAEPGSESKGGESVFVVLPSLHRSQVSIHRA